MNEGMDTAATTNTPRKRRTWARRLGLATALGLGLVTALSLALLSCGLKTRPATGTAVSQAEGEEAGDRAPDFALRDVEGATISLDDLLAGGRPAVLLFYRGYW